MWGLDEICRSTQSQALQARGTESTERLGRGKWSLQARDTISLHEVSAFLYVLHPP